MEQSLVVKEAFSKNHKLISGDLINRIRDILGREDIVIKSMSTDTGYKSFNETLNIQIGDEELFLRFTTTLE